MAQRKHLDDFLRSRIIGRLECRRTLLEVSEELGIVQSVISRPWQRFQDDGNVRCYSTGRPPSYIRQLLPKETDGAQHQTCLVSSLQLPVRQFQGRTCTRLGHIGLYTRRPVRCVQANRNSLSPTTNLQ
ncbi:uncharacterized protein TNCV_4122921 [Trichonephila clavipes]|nr:uncharacterized protein TNCV_4122921 [Trichonephila clavipes]